MKRPKGLLLLVAAQLPIVLGGVTGCKSVVTFESTPSGAVLQCAKLPSLGETPCTHPIKHGTYSFVFSLPGHQELRLERRIGGREQLIHAMMIPGRTRLDIDTVPPDANVQVTRAGRAVDLGQTVRPHDALDLDDARFWGQAGAAVFHVEASAPGYTTIVEDVLLGRYESTRLSYVLKERRAELSVRSNPPGVDVYDRSLGYLGRTPFTTFIPADQLARISARRDQRGRDTAQLQLSGRLDGYEPFERVVSVTVDGNSNEIAFDLALREGVNP